jgi:hypothetical protein
VLWPAELQPRVPSFTGVRPGWPTQRTRTPAVLGKSQVPVQSGASGASRANCFRLLGVTGVNSKAKGEISEGHAIAQLLTHRYAPSMPFGDNQRYDLIVDDGERLWRAQVKTARRRCPCAWSQPSPRGLRMRSGGPRIMS